MDEDNMPLAFPNGNVYSREVRVTFRIFTYYHRLRVNV